MNPMYLFLFVMMCSLAGCNNDKNNAHSEPAAQTGQPQASEQRTRGNLQRIMIDSTAVWVEIAQDNLTRTKGLMFRNEMPADQGMLFIFPQPQILSFWMKNTYLPLDIAFIDQRGIITDIHQMVPLDTVPRYTSSVPTIYALEVNQGFFQQHGIEVGDTVNFY